MKTLKFIYYRIKFKEALSYAEYWRENFNANLKDVEKGKVCLDHVIYWMSKMLEYIDAMDKELES
jgi:hypothetical protein